LAKANLDSNSQYLNKGLEDPVLSSFSTYLLEKDTLKVLVLRGRDLARTSFKARIATPLETDSLTP
jgi:RNA-binding protein YhbY